MAELLIENGANVNEKNDAGYTPLALVGFYGDYKDIAQLLIEKGANVNSKTYEGW